MSSEISVGIVGAGVVVRERHLPVIAAQPGLRLAWVCDPRPQARELVAGLHGEAVATADEPMDLLAGTDVVLVATPPATHADRVVEALDAGCHVLCEKPLALDPAECRRVAVAAERAGRVVSVAFNLRHHPAAVALRTAVRDGSLGRVRAVRSISSSPGRSGTTDWVGHGGLGGDVLWEVGSHHADLWRFVLGEDVMEAAGQASDDVAAVSARTEQGTQISALFAWGPGPQNELEVMGDRARARASFYGADPLAVTANGRTATEPGERLRAAARTLRAAPAMVAAARGGGAFAATYAREWTAVLAAVRGQGPNPCSAEDGLAAAEAVRLLRAGCGLAAEASVASR